MNNANVINATHTMQIWIHDRNYSQYEFQYIDTNKAIDLTNPEYSYLNQFNPIDAKLLSKDVFTVNRTTLEVKIIHSPMRTSKEIAGVLLLENNKTFGRTPNKKRLLYKCIPDDVHLPNFLIPYEMAVGFSKVFKNKYVVFKYLNWEDKHPQGSLVEVLGDVDQLDVFYEYQLYCKSLHISLTEFNNKTREQLNKKTADEYIHQIMNNPRFIIHDRRTSKSIFTIDPKGSSDYDDGFSIEPLEPPSAAGAEGAVGSPPSAGWKISIYIANVYFWLETFGLWKSFSKRVATIYLPERRRPMLPTILSDTLCSLQQSQSRFAFEMTLTVDANGVIDENSIAFSNVLINVYKNYEYEDPRMLAKDKNYQRLFDISNRMDANVKTSHDVVSHWMIYMNKICGELMANRKFGIFRSSVYFNKNKGNLLDASLTEDAKRVITNWNNTTGQYLLYNQGDNLEHELMQWKSYIHITSPIRRIIDLLNQMMLFENMQLVHTLSEDAKEFLDNWKRNIEYINISMRSIRKIQTDCEVLHRCFNDKRIMEREHRGVVFDKIAKSDGTYSYMVYLEDIQMLTRYTCTAEFVDQSYIQFRLYLFEDENKIKRKIRLAVCEPGVSVASS